MISISQVEHFQTSVTSVWVTIVRTFTAPLPRWTMPSPFVQRPPAAIAASIPLPASSTMAIDGSASLASSFAKISILTVTNEPTSSTKAIAEVSNPASKPTAGEIITPFPTFMKEPTSSTTDTAEPLIPVSKPSVSMEISLITNTITTLLTSSITAIDTSRSGELSSRAKVGITVGSTIIGLFLFVGIIFLVLRSKRREQNTRNDIDRREEGKSGDRVYQKAELSNDHMRHELPEILLQNLRRERQVHELAGDINAFELDADMMRSRTELGAATPVPSGSEG
ncbi:hypothetical protein N7G274_008921 [Stereocaulon virgatum]|uniref:Uncharacterized protein n=1 Tax=Stereocaulon virgatum TaxID=373712 RepID=A0ABR3ZX93_9LECA